NKERLSKAEPVMLPGLGARQEDISEPLLIVADACGGHWPEDIRQSFRHFFRVMDTEEASTGTELLRDIKTMFAHWGPDRISSEDLCAWLCGLPERSWAGWNQGTGITQRQLARILKPYGIESRNIRLAPDKVPKGYCLSDFQTAFSLYLPEDPAPNR